MKGKNNNKGFTMAEMMITVAIIAVLAGLAVVGVVQYRERMHRLEMTAIAKEIFVTAQNHLSMADGQGYPGMNGNGAFGSDEDDDPGVYHFIFAAGSTDSPNNTNTVFSLMLPPGAIDETVRTGGSYIIRYQKSPALILDVYYATRDGKYGHSFTTSEFKTLNTSTNKGDALSGVVYGWYGGEGLQPGQELRAPSIKIKNAEVLQAVITDNNTSRSGYKVQIIVRGLQSDGLAYKSWAAEAAQTPVILDDICSASREHFSQLFSETGTYSVIRAFYPGENISVQAKVFSSEKLTNVAASELKITNSLFDDATTVTKVYDSSYSANAVISNIRHLENLSSAISGCGTTALKVDNAVQTVDLKWSEFRNAASIKDYPDWSIVVLDGDATNPKNVLRPVFPANAINYNGGYHSISSGTADTVPINETTGNVGLFGTLTGSTVKNLELINFSVTGGESSKVGTLAGSLNGSSTIENVLSRHEVNKTASVSGGANSVAGGLIGEVNGGTVTACAAAVRVSGTTAGGLIGTSSGTVTGCYSAGHVKTVKDGENVLAVRYDDTPASFDVIGQTAGGLIGSNSGPVSCSYSTCSVYSNSEDRSTGCAGGFVGSLAKGGSISNCYSTGLVKQATGELTNTGVVNNAFVGATAAASQAGKENKYFKIINEVPIYKEGSTTDIKEFMYKAAGGPPDADNDASAFDETAESYNAFVPSTWMNARPYEGTLVGNKWISVLADYYQNKYIFPTVSQLGAKINNSVIPVNYYVNTHYGDWPAPEIFVINTPST